MSKLNFKLNISDDCSEGINQVFGIWELAERHEGGVTVKYTPMTYQDKPSYWVNTQYKLSEVASAHAKTGRENPSAEAYASMQKELKHYLDGYMLNMSAQIWLDDILLAEDSICTDFSYEYWNSVEECAEVCAKDHFSIYSLVREAKQNAKTMINKLEEA